VETFEEKEMNRMGRDNARSEGALLIELMVTLLMFVVGIFGLSSAMVAAQRSQAWSRDRLLASRSLASQLEAIGNTPFDNIKSTYDAKTLNGVYSSGSGYQTGTNSRAPTVRAAVTTIDSRLLGVTLTATWTDATGTRTLSLYQEFGK
jgi:Tfp pilus assembly protein PilV